MKRLFLSLCFLLLLYLPSFAQVFTLDAVQPTHAPRGTLAPVLKVNVTGHTSGDTLTFNITDNSGGFNGTYSDFNAGPGEVHHLFVYKDSFDPTNPETNRIANKEFSTDESVVTLTTSSISDTEFDLIIVYDIDGQDFSAGGAEAARISAQFNALNVNDIPISRIAVSQVCAADLGSVGTNPPDTIDQILVERQNSNLAAMVFSIESFNANFTLTELQINNDYGNDGQKSYEEFETESTGGGIGSATLIEINDADPINCNTGDAFLDQTIWKELGTLTNSDSSTSNDFLSRTQGVFDGEDVKDGVNVVEVTAGAGNKKFFLIVYKLCPTCSLVDKDDERFIVSSRVGRDHIKGTMGALTSTGTIEVTNTTTNIPATSGQKVFTEYVGLTLNNDPLFYHGLVNPSNVFGQGSSSDMIKMTIRSQGVVSTLNSIVLESTQGDLTNVDSVFVFQDEAKQQLIGSVTTVSQPDRVSIDMHVSNTPTTPGLVFTTNEEKNLYVVYEFKQNATFGDYDSLLRDGAGTMNATLVDIIGAMSTTASVGPEQQVSVVTLQSSVATLEDLSTTIRPLNSLEGMMYVPMLTFTINAETAIPSASFIIENDFGMYSASNQGVRRISIFQDCSEESSGEPNCSVADQALDISIDKFLGASSVFTSRTSNVPGIPVNIGRNKYIVAYDIGLEIDANNNQVDAKFGGLVGSAVAGVVPNPEDSVALGVLPNQFSVTGISVTDSSSTVIDAIDNSMSTINARISVRNGFNEQVHITKVQPVVYSGGIEGNDISHEFRMAGADSSNDPFDFSDTNTQTLAAGQSLNFDFHINPFLLRTNGNVVMDAFINFFMPLSSVTAPSDFVNITPSKNISLYRYQVSGNTWKSAGGVESANVAGSSLVASLSSSSSLAAQASYEFLGYIESVSVLVGSTPEPFQNFHPLDSNRDLIITFKNPDQIDFSSIGIQINNETSLLNSFQASSVDDPQFAYNIDEGTVTVKNISGNVGLNTLSLSVSDTAGNSLSASTFSFFMSDALRIDHFLAFPNPYSVVKQDRLQFGFSVTQQPSKITIYIVSSTGRLVGTVEVDDAAVLAGSGYKIVDWVSQEREMGKAVAPGIYIAKIVVEGATGKESKVTKFAVY